MKNGKKIAIFGFLFLSVAASCIASGWETKAKQAFDLDEYEKCIETVNSVKGDADGLNRSMFLAFSNLQLYQYTKSKDYLTKYQSHSQSVHSRAQVNDLVKVLYFVNLTDKPEVVKSSRILAKKIFSSMNMIEDVPILFPFAESNDRIVKTLTYETIGRIFKTKREVVDKGGNLRSQDMKIMSDPNLIRILFDNAADSKAVEVLLLIQEPALKHGETLSEPHVAKVQEKILKTIKKRQKMHPSSNWYSATGQVRL